MSFYHSAAQRRTGYSTKVLTPVVSPVTNQELADWIRVDATDPVLPGLLIAATSYVIERLQSELINRARVVYYQDWPLVGRNYGGTISRSEARAQEQIKLPYSTLVSVEELKLYGVATTGYKIQQTTPGMILIEDIQYAIDSDKVAIECSYTAGYGATADDVPEAIKIAITMLAAFMYEHRGSCDAQQAFAMSGAKELLTPYMNEVVAL